MENLFSGVDILFCGNLLNKFSYIIDVTCEWARPFGRDGRMERGELIFWKEMKWPPRLS